MRKAVDIHRASFGISAAINSAASGSIISNDIQICTVTGKLSNQRRNNISRVKCLWQLWNFSWAFHCGCQTVRMTVRKMETWVFWGILNELPGKNEMVQLQYVCVRT